jgi:hypothetical protein
MSYCVFSLRLKCRLFEQRWGRFIYVDASCTVNFPPGVGNRTDLIAIHLTPPTIRAALGLARVHTPTCL